MENQKSITEYIKRYISNNINLDSAIMIKGKWGCGKTYFIKHFLSPKLEEFLKREKKQLCYISLNGLSSTKEFMKRIQSVIIKENFKFLKNQNSDSGIIEIVTGIDTIYNDINLQGWANIVYGATKKLNNVISKKNISSTVFIFDDLERCYIPLQEILGIINDLIEHEHCKCVIIANEEEINKKEDFIKVKEKFISRTIEFIPDLDAFFKNEKKKYENQPLSNLDDENWEKFKNINIHSFGLNLRIVQSALFIANEVFYICIDIILQEENILIQDLLGKLLTDIYEIEKYYKEGHPRPKSKNENGVLSIFTLGSDDSLSSYKEIFTFVLDVVYDGVYDKETIQNDIRTYIENSKINGKFSPIAKLKEYYYMEDEIIQKNLDLINATVKSLNLSQFSDFFNFLIPLLDLGFAYNQQTDFNQVLKVVLKKIDIFATENDWSFEVIGMHTTLKEEQARKYQIAMRKVKKKLDDNFVLTNECMDELLKGEDWINKLQLDLKKNEYNYRKSKKYLSYFNLNILLNNLKQSSNAQLSEFRNILYNLYRRSNCLESFSNDIDAVNIFLIELESISITKKINNLTIKFIISDLRESFPEN